MKSDGDHEPASKVNQANLIPTDTLLVARLMLSERSLPTVFYLSAPHYLRRTLV